MDLKYDFYHLPLRFDAQRLAGEAAGFSEDEWRAHPSGFVGNSALQLISTGGQLQSDRLQGPQLPTPLLQRCPYLMQVLASFESVLGRTRLMRLAPGCDAKAHMDASYYWHQRIRVHVPIQTHPDIMFHSGDSAVHMGAGDCWVFNTWNMHTVKNDTDQTRIHLVADTVGSPALWDLMDSARTIPPSGDDARQSPRFIEYREGAEVALETESINFPVVMSPWEQRSLVAPLLDDLRGIYAAEPHKLARLEAAVERYLRQWFNAWMEYGESPAGWPVYENYRASLRAALESIKGQLYLSNGMEATYMVDEAAVAPALNTELAVKGERRAQVGLAAAQSPPAPEAPAQPPAAATSRLAKRFHRPVILVCAPRSGSSFLFETLSRSPGLHTVGGESHQLFESIPKLQPANRLFESNRLTAQDADAQTCDIIRQSFLAKVRDREGKPPARNAPFRLLEKTPKNALRIPFLEEVFPGALYIYLYRKPEESLASIAEAWESGRFVTYPEVPGWSRGQWSLLLTPGWRELEGKSLFEIAQQQWLASNQQVIEDLAAIEPERWTALSYEDLLADTPGEIARLCQFAGLPWDADLGQPLPLSRHTVSPPEADKWRRHEADITPLLDATRETTARATAMIADSKQRVYPQRLKLDPSRDPESSPLRSSYTSNLSQMLASGNTSLVVTTYQAGKVVLVRSRGGKLNTHFAGVAKPMGLAKAQGKLAVGTRNAVEFYIDVPRPEKQGDPGRPGRYVKRLEAVTGNIDIHEMAWSSTDLWLINTRFSCLCTLDLQNNFVPRWQPWFISKLVPEDRCHLNGLCLVDDRPRYVTSLGQSDKAGGWRENRAKGGLIMDIKENRIVASGLSMPHSPRWYRDQLWVLESGKGSLAKVDVATGQIQTVAELPGFTRGLDFVDKYAFIGLSEVRETAVFGSIPITERAKERICGVWVVDITDGRIVAWLRFEGDVNEIFAVEALPGIAEPELVQSHEAALDETWATPNGTLVK